MTRYADQEGMGLATLMVLCAMGVAGLLAFALLCGGCAALPLWAYEQAGISEQAAHDAAVEELYDAKD